jgi:multidrug efflux pump subunit AcrA (membrane-fusion protein)
MPVNTQRVRRLGGSTLIVIAIVAAIVLLGTAAMIMRGAVGDSDQVRQQDEFVVRRGSFEITVPASGELAALKQIEIRNQLEYRAVLTEIIEEGTYVKKDEVLFSFADDEIRNKIKDAEDAVNNSEAARIASESTLEIRLSSSKSELDKADLDVMLADLALKAWEEGEVVARRKELDLDIETAEINYNRLADRYLESEELVKQEFISQDELKQDEIAMIEAKARLEEANLDKRIYNEYEFVQQKHQKESDVEQAQAERERIAERHKAELETARADVTSKQHQLQSRKERLTDLREQLEFCTVRAPSEGLVVFASSLEQHRWSRMNQGDLQAGTEIRKNELVMILPDTSAMTAEVKVNESLSGLIDPGQRAVVTSDAIPDVALEGEVISVGVLAESGGWRDPNRRDYTVKVLLTDGNDLGLKPSMRCKTDIYVGRVDDAIHVPLQAVFREGPAAFVYVPQGGGFEQRLVALGQASGLHIEITDGLRVGEQVLLREPKPREIVARLTDSSPAAAMASDGGWPREGKGPKQPRSGERAGKGPPRETGKGQRRGST